MASLKARENALQILKDYNGDNSYILSIKRDIYVKGKSDSLNDFAVEYINKNFNFQVREINKTIKMADWWAESKKEEWQIDILPTRLKIYFLLGETETTYHCIAQYRQSVAPHSMFLNKKAVLTNFTAKDYKTVNVDFERYDRLADNSVMFKKKGKIHHIMPHQEEGVKFLLARKKCILADDQGLGKSLELSIAAIEGNFDSILIICPASLKQNWKEELLWYVQERDITIVDSFTDKKKNELESMLGYGEGKSGKTVAELKEEFRDRGKWRENRFVIVNFDILNEFYKIPKTRSNQSIQEAYNESPMLQYCNGKKTLLIVDEAHRLSEQKAMRYKIIKDFVKRSNPDSIYLSTGTPITNDPTNFYNLLSIIGESITDDWSYYMKRYCGAIEICVNKQERDFWTNNYLRLRGKTNWHSLTTDEKVQLRDYLKQHTKMATVPKEATNLDELRERTSHIYLRRVKEDLKSLTVKKNIHEVFYNFSPSQWAEYARLWDEYEKQRQENGFNGELNKTLLEGGVYRAYCANQMVPNTIKLTDKLLMEGRKVVIMCCYDEELYKLQEYYGDRCVIYNGKMSLKEKEESKNSFINNPNITIFIGNLTSAGVGLTLTVSNAMVFNQFNYSCADCKQGEDRIFRIGQTKDVDIYYQMFIGTQFEKMWNKVLKKELMINTVIKKEGDK